MTTINKYPPKLACKPEFDKEKGVFIKLKYMSRETKIRLMDKSTVEEVLYTLRAFENKAKDINLPNARYLEKFVTCLGNKARDRWGKLEATRPENTFQPTEWEEAKKEWIKVYVKDRNAKETIIYAWSSTRAYHKPIEVSVEDHVDRIDTLCHHIDMLPGAREEKLTDLERKSMLFNTFPKKWRDEFTLFRTDPETASEHDIIDYMEKKKELTDHEQSKKTKAEGKKKKMDENKKKRKEAAGNKDCRLHPGQHLWKDCPMNRRGKTYNKNFGRGRGGRYQQGRGGFQGRGFHNHARGFNNNGRGGFQGRGFHNQGRGFGRGRGNFNPNDQHFQESFGAPDDTSTIATNQTGQQSNWDSSYHPQNSYQSRSPDNYYSDQRWY